MTSNDGFSVVAPIERHGARLDVRQEGVLLRLVEAMDLVDEEDACAGRAVASSVSASATTSRSSFTPGEHGGERDEVRARWRCARSRASVVLPLPGGPHRMSECEPARLDHLAQHAARGRAGASWPTNSSSVRGRMRSASGARAARGGSLGVRRGNSSGCRGIFVAVPQRSAPGIAQVRRGRRRADEGSGWRASGRSDLVVKRDRPRAVRLAKRMAVWLPVAGSACSVDAEGGSAARRRQQARARARARTCSSSSAATGRSSRSRGSAGGSADPRGQPG